MSLRPYAKAPDPPLSRAAAARGETDAPELTPRECEVMHWVSQGKRDREIAIILGLSPRTVEKHVCHILEKLRVETRTAAVHQSQFPSEPTPRSFVGRERNSPP